MRKVALRGLFARKLRLALTVLAVVLGTTLIAGTYVFTDSINNAFDTIFTVSNRGTDAAITPHKTIDTSNNGGTAPTVAGPVLDKVRTQGGAIENEFRTQGPMPAAFCSDPFGNGFCVIGEGTD